MALNRGCEPRITLKKLVSDEYLYTYYYPFLHKLFPECIERHFAKENALWRKGFERGVNRAMFVRELHFRRRFPKTPYMDNSNKLLKYPQKLLAASLGVRVPKTYICPTPWKNVRYALETKQLDLSNFVLKPNDGSCGEGVYVVRDGVDQLRLKEFDPATADFEDDEEVLVEEVLDDELGFIPPRDHKCFMVNEQVIRVCCIKDRSKAQGRSQTYTTEVDENYAYATDSVRLVGGGSGNDARVDESEAPPKPKCWDEIIENARKIARFFDTFIRVDFYATVDGAVFGEIQFSVNPDDYSVVLDNKLQAAFLDPRFLKR